MSSLLRLSRLIDWINERVGRAVMWLVLVAVVISAGNALVRKLFNTSSNALLEIQWYLFAAIFMLAAGYTFLRNEHVRIDILTSRLSPRGQNVVDIVGILFFLLPMAGLILWLSWPIVMTSLASGEMSQNSGGLIRWPVKMMLPLGLGLLVLQAFSELVKRIAFLAGHGPDPLQKKSSGAATADLVAAIKAQREGRVEP
ncbi:MULTISPECIES: TRAP transporter small permease subunit [Thauera]|uniref:TRAP transporter small permease protein n=1 Tax=Thauera aminoaromatica TaxID=164330 RepID=C4ZPB8_THASP|nr:MULTISPECIES: TRAP transporter small permease subunit [Thauera]OPZ06376.1 MAG: 2,3-diketo-L-gulonate TRAP transporter small permease protein YiaM [Alphaproteobacteria bacterium ADurb.BinA305]TMW74425.1 TRAP transporter small permease subunit [Thauera sp. UPWRP]ACK54314.1 Tripartite ATP-independent periplasmic transporter DctQ component [Thauera aminoaromatica]KIN91126.1 tripartite ATP-independent periplasmic transporter, DctQ component family protein [Thauera sp. SWB20]TXH92332.1 MAG: TRAP 